MDTFYFGTVDDYSIDIHTSFAEPHFEINGSDGELIGIVYLENETFIRHKDTKIDFHKLDEYLKERPEYYKGLSRWEIMCIDWNNMNPDNRFTPPKKQPNYKTIKESIKE